MKKLIACLVFLAVIFFAACHYAPNSDTLRVTEGIVLVSVPFELNGIQGKKIFWDRYKSIERIKNMETSAVAKIWFVYPPERFTPENLRRVRLTYKFMTKFADPQIVMVYLIKTEDLGPIKF